MRTVIRFLFLVLSVSVSAQGQVPWVVSIDLGNPNMEYGVSQRLGESPAGWTKVARVAGETGRGLLLENPAERVPEGLYLDIRPPFSEAAHGKTLWVLAEVFSPDPTQVGVFFNPLGSREEGRVAQGAAIGSSLPQPYRARPNEWGFVLFRLEDAALQEGLAGVADLRIDLPDGETLLNRVMIARVGPEFHSPDTGGLGMSFYPQNYARIQGPTLSPLGRSGQLVPVQGEVIDDQGIGGVGGVRVELAPERGGEAVYDSYTNSLGEYRFPLVEEGNYFVRFAFSGKKGWVGDPRAVRISRGAEGEDLGTDAVAVSGYPFTSVFRSGVDGSERTYALYLPEDYRAREDRTHGLIVALHDVGEGPLQLLPDMAAANETATATPFILLGPGGRGDSNYEGIGEADVLEAISHALENYRVDPDRIHITGYGMGGNGALKLATRYPGKFASVSAVAAFTDLTKLTGSSQTPKFQRRLLRMASPLHHAANLREMPVRLYQPKEIQILAEQGRAFRDEMAKQVQPFLYRELPETGRDLIRKVYGSPDFYRVTAEDRRRLFPNRVAFEASSVTPGKSHWLTVDTRERADRPFRVDARVSDRNTYWVQSANVTGLNLNLLHPGLIQNRPAKVWWNGNQVWSGIPEREKVARLQMNRRGGRWDKRPFFSGSSREVFLESFLYVTGEGIRWKPKEKAYAAWAKNREWAPPARQLVSAQEVGAHELRNRNLVLFGLPSENSLVQTVHDDLPIKIAGKNAISIEGNVFKGNDLGFATVFPNPLAEDRLILWVASFTEKGIENLSNTGFRWPDYLVVDDEMSKSGEADDALAAGFYDANWRFSQSDFYKRPESVAEVEADRAKARTR